MSGSVGIYMRQRSLRQRTSNWTLSEQGETGTSRIRYIKARQQALKPGRRFVGASSMYIRSVERRYSIASIIKSWQRRVRACSRLERVPAICTWGPVRVQLRASSSLGRSPRANDCIGPTGLCRYIDGIFVFLFDRVFNVAFLLSQFSML